MNVAWIIVIILNALALIAAIIFIFTYRRKFAGIKHFEKIRDEVTVRKPKEEKEEEYTGGLTLNIGRIIGGFITILVGINMLPIINNVVSSASVNVTGPAQNMLSLVTVFYTLGIVVVGIGIIMGILDDSGLM